MSEAPGYWMSESSGVLRPVIEAYQAGGPLNPMQVATMRAYLRQWVCAPGWDRNPHADAADRARLAELRRRVEGLDSRDAIDDWIDDAEAFGLDPL